MTNIINLITILIVGLLLSCSSPSSDKGIRTNLDGTINIQGRVLVEGTNMPPKGINTINVTNRWVDVNKGENEMVYINRDGYYNINIRKGDTIKLTPNYLIYKQIKHSYMIQGLDKNQILNFEVTLDSTTYKSVVKDLPKVKTHIDQILNEVNPEKLVTISGTIMNKKTGKPIANLIVSPVSVLNSSGLGSYNLTNKDGQFSMRVPQNISVGFNTLDETRSAYVRPTNDTIITLTL